MTGPTGTAERWNRASWRRPGGKLPSVSSGKKLTQPNCCTTFQACQALCVAVSDATVFRLAARPLRAIKTRTGPLPGTGRRRSDMTDRFGYSVEITLTRGRGGSQALHQLPHGAARRDQGKAVRPRSRACPAAGGSAVSRSGRRVPCVRSADCRAGKRPVLLTTNSVAICSGEAAGKPGGAVESDRLGAADHRIAAIIEADRADQPRHIAVGRGHAAFGRRAQHRPRPRAQNQSMPGRGHRDPRIDGRRHRPPTSAATACGLRKVFGLMTSVVRNCILRRF